MAKAYELSFDLIKILDIFLMSLGVLALLRHRLSKHPNDNFRHLISLLMLSIFNSYLLRFTHWQVPNFIPALGFFYGPALVFFITFSPQSQKKAFKTFYVHWVPGILALGITTFISSQSLIYLLLLHFGSYLLLSFYHLFSSKQVPHFLWLTGISLIYGVAIAEALFVVPKMQFRYVILVGAMVCVVLIAIGVFQKALSIYQFYKSRHTQKYKDSFLSEENSQAMAVRLEQLMHQQKPYLKDGLDLASLSELLETHPRHLSQVINQNFNRNFFDYINSFRISEAQNLLRNPKYKNHKIYEIMYEVGFNSRSSFNTAFKKGTGLTAKQFRDKYSAI